MWKPRLTEAVKEGVVTPEEADIISSYSEAERRFENSNGTPKRCLQVARAWTKEQERHSEGKPRPHFARYHPDIVKAVAVRLPLRQRVYDPFAGTLERLAQLESADLGGHEVWGVELEPEWASYPHPRLLEGDSRHAPFEDNYFDAVVVSPSYGNRDADRTGEWWDNCDRRTYAAALGRNVSDASVCVPFSSEEYKKGHLQVWCETTRVLKPSGVVFLNVKNSIKGGSVVHVAEWHRSAFLDVLGYKELECFLVDTPGRMSGANYSVRAEQGERVFVFTPQSDSSMRASAIWQPHSSPSIVEADVPKIGNQS